MCGWIAVVGSPIDSAMLRESLQVMRHRGPDAEGSWKSPSALCTLGHCRLSIIDLSSAGTQPMTSNDHRYSIVLNGEIYNYLELRRELQDCWLFQTQTDTEVLLASYARWGEACLDRLLGMFAFAIWDEPARKLFVARDRFGVKPVYFATLPSQQLAFASEIKALRQLGVNTGPDLQSWATYLTYGISDHCERTFWDRISNLRAGHALVWQNGSVVVRKWYDLASIAEESESGRPESEVIEEYQGLMLDSIGLRFRSDVPVGINLSGGLDSSVLLRQVHLFQRESSVCAFTFITGDPLYDQLDAVQQMLACTRHPHILCKLGPEEVPDLASRLQTYQEEPFGGMATIAYSKIFQEARRRGIIVLLDGQGLDEQWAGYEYYARADQPEQVQRPVLGPVQGSVSKPVRPECLEDEFRNLALPLFAPHAFPDELRNLQYRDAVFTKIPRALRYNDRISMMHGTELREPFLDHRLFELALAQRGELKIRDGVQKWLLRKMHGPIMPLGVINAPKQPVQTPQREWLANQLKGWLLELLNDQGLWALGWLRRDKVEESLRAYFDGTQDNSYFLWQWLSLTLWLNNCLRAGPRCH